MSNGIHRTSCCGEKDYAAQQKIDSAAAGERAAIVRWLLDYGYRSTGVPSYGTMAEAIERGEHLK